MAVACALAVAGSGCVDEAAWKAIHGQPIVERPPDGVLLARSDMSPPAPAIPGFNNQGHIEIVWASPRDVELLGAWYADRFGGRYGFRQSSEGGGIRLDGRASDSPVRVLVRLSPTGPRTIHPDTEKQLKPAPPGTRTYATVLVYGPAP